MTAMRATDGCPIGRRTTEPTPEGLFIRPFGRRTTEPTPEGLFIRPFGRRTTGNTEFGRLPR